MNQRGTNGLATSHFLDAPQLSIVVASVHSIHDLEACLNTLVKQSRGEEIEIIVADSCQYSLSQDMMIKYPDVIFIRFPEKTTLPVLWGAGIAHSKGQIIAIIESACIVDDHWTSSILRAHESSHPVIGGAVEIKGCRKWVDWAAYFCEYGQFMPPLVEGVVNELPGNNVSFKRWVLNKGREFVENGFWKAYWCRKLQEEGIELILSPSIVVYCKKSYCLLSFLIRRFHHGRCFAGMRVAQASIPTRLYYLAGSPLLPFLSLTRTVSAFIPKKRYLKEFILSFPISILSIVAWSIGEFWGYLTGAGKSCAYVY